ncbi:MAG: hypothetical protein WC849_02105 [Candidatus Paceibacterota bacterium]
MENTEQNEEKNPLEKLYEELPQNVQEAISSVAVAEKIQEIAKRNGLHVDEAGIVSDEATMVMLGIENPKDFVDGLQNKLKLPREKVVELAKDVNKEIFEPIRESLRKMYENEEGLFEENSSSLNSNLKSKISPNLPTMPGATGQANLETKNQNEIPTQTSTMTTEELNQKLLKEDSIFKSRMGGIVNMPKEEIVLEQNNPPKIENKIRHVDPYKEPLE